MKGKWPGLAATLLTLGGLTAAGQGLAGSATGEQIRMFGSFYQDSIDTFFNVVGEELLNMPTGQFEALANERQRKTCSAIVDQATYRSVMFRSFVAAHGRHGTVDFMKRGKEAGGFRFEDLKVRFDKINEKAIHCLHNATVRVAAKDGVPFSEGYADTRTEFALRDLYKSQLPFVRWTWNSVPAGREREDMRVLIRSMERKYLFDIADP